MKSLAFIGDDRRYGYVWSFHAEYIYLTDYFDFS